MAFIVVYHTNLDQNLRVLVDELNARGHTLLDGHWAFNFKYDLTKADLFVCYMPSSVSFSDVNASNIALQLTNIANMSNIPVQFCCDDVEALLKVIDEQWATKKIDNSVIGD